MNRMHRHRTVSTEDVSIVRNDINKGRHILTKKSVLNPSERIKTASPSTEEEFKKIDVLTSSAIAKAKAKARAEANAEGKSIVTTPTEPSKEVKIQPRYEEIKNIKALSNTLENKINACFGNSKDSGTDSSSTSSPDLVSTTQLTKNGNTQRVVTDYSNKKQAKLTFDYDNKVVRTPMKTTRTFCPSPIKPGAAAGAGGPSF